MSQPYIYLGYYHGHSIAVSDEAYEQIKAIIEAGKVCTRCQGHYSQENPETARNICLKCFLGDEARSSLSYVGPYMHQSAGTSYTYHYELLIDTKGYIYTISPDLSQERESRDEFLTMRHWGFHVPEQVIYNGETVKLHASEWGIFGDIHDPVIVGRNHHSRLHDSKTFAFLLYKDQEAKELNKRKGDIKDLFREARRRVEATKDEKGWYHTIDEYEFSHEIEDYNLYAHVAKIEIEWMQARAITLDRPATPPILKQEVAEKKDRPAFGNPDWIQIAKGKMRPWERAIWKDILGEDAL